MPFSAFADGIVCPACGGTVTKQERRLVSAHDDFYKCDTCGKWAWVNKLGSLSLFSVGDQQILDAADASALINFSFNNGHLIPAKQAPSGIGRKDLPGYADDNGTPYVTSSGKLSIQMQLNGFDTSYGYLQAIQYDSWLDHLADVAGAHAAPVPAARSGCAAHRRRGRLLRHRHHQIYSGVTICVIHFCCSCRTSGRSVCIT